MISPSSAQASFERRIKAECACVDSSAVACWAIRHEIPDWEVEDDGGPCMCECHNGCDDEKVEEK
jgi:hypothetical protein